MCQESVAKKRGGSSGRTLASFFLDVNEREKRKAQSKYHRNLQEEVT
jgi:hypothetical protein